LPAAGGCRNILVAWESSVHDVCAAVSLSVQSHRGVFGAGPRGCLSYFLLLCAGVKGFCILQKGND
jgi:hypothetical protein